MTKNILIITGDYPYTLRESFFEIEIDFFVNNFNEIVVAPARISPIRRKTPDSVQVNQTYFRFANRRFRKLVAFFSLRFAKALVTHKKHILSLNAIRRILSFLVDSNNTFQWLESLNLEGKWIIYTYWFNGRTHGAIEFAGSRPNFHVVSRAHSYDLYEYRYSPNFWPFRLESILKVSKLYIISKNGYNYLMDRYPEITSLKKVVVSRLGVRDPFVLSKRSTDGGLRVLTVSNISAEKRVDLIANYLSEFAFRNPNIMIHWTHFGDGLLKEKVFSKLSNIFLNNFNWDLKGNCPNLEVLEFYKENHIDCFINLSEYEGIPVSIMEAQAHGVYVLSTNVGGVSEIVNNEIGCLLDRFVSYDEFSSAITAVVENSIPAPDLIYQFWKVHFDATKNFGHFIKDMLDSFK
jgi:glycosyltransferase involved in cell wall biosynthesis